MPLPVILLCAPEHAEVLESEFSRYVRDYDVRVTRTAAEACDVLRGIVAAGGRVPLLVTESRLPDTGTYQAFVEWRGLVPTAKRVVAAHWSTFLADAEQLRGGLAKGKYDAYLLMPRGARDEEFHGAIVEMLSDWGSSVADPEVDSVRLVSPPGEPVTAAVRDFLDRMGMPNRTYPPDSEVGQEVLAAYDGEAGWPVVNAFDREPFLARPPTTWRAGSTATPPASRPRAWSTWSWSGPGRPVSRPRSTARRKG